MELSVKLYLLLLALVAAGRLAELRISRRHQVQMALNGIAKRIDPRFRWMVALHVGLLAGSALEVVALHRPFLPKLGAAMGLLFLLATALRWWAIRTLGTHWNVEVMVSTSLGVVSTGPYRWVRHPNYVAVFVEMAALPLIHTAWITALAGTAANAWILRHRIALEESMLQSDPRYSAAMAGKPRFLPKPF